MGIQGIPLDKTNIINAIRIKKGIIAHVADMLECDRTTIYDWMSKDPEVEKAVNEARDQGKKERIDQEEEIINEAYKSIMALLQNKDPTATIFTLKSKGDWEKKQAQQSIVINSLERPY